MLAGKSSSGAELAWGYQVLLEPTLNIFFFLYLSALKNIPDVWRGSLKIQGSDREYYRLLRKFQLPSTMAQGELMILGFAEEVSGVRGHWDWNMGRSSHIWYSSGHKWERGCQIGATEEFHGSLWTSEVSCFCRHLRGIQEVLGVFKNDSLLHNCSGDNKDLDQLWTF